MGSHNESVTDFTTFNHAWMRSIRGFLLDITGVLYNSSGNGGIAITGSVDAVNRLYAESKVRFVSNESTSTRAKLAEKLHRLGFTLDLQHIFTPAPVAANYVKSRNLKPHLLVHKGIVSEFDDCINSEPKDCVVVGDAEEEFTYTNMNTAFRVLMNSTNPLLISLGCGRFYQRVDGPTLDVGGYALALKYATNAEHVVMGKPNKEYFMHAIEDMNLTKDEVVMIGDDIISDVSAAQQHGIRGVQVRTGKWRAEWETHPDVKPDLIADNLNTALNIILGHH